MPLTRAHDVKRLRPCLALSSCSTHLRDGEFTLAGTPTQRGEYRLTVSVGCYGTGFAGQTGSDQLVVRVEP